MTNRDSVLWACPACGRTFANRNQTHTCATLSDLERHFERSDPLVREIFDALVERVRRFGPVTILPEKSRIAFHIRMSFAALSTRKSHLVGHLVLASRNPDPRFSRIESLSPRNHVHHFRLAKLDDLDEEFCLFLEQAYAVGEQKHV